MSFFLQLPEKLRQIFPPLLHQLRINTLSHTHMLFFPKSNKQDEHTLKRIKPEINKA